VSGISSNFFTPGEKRLQHSSSTSVANSGFSRLDVAAARVLVKRLVEAKLRRGPPDFLILSDHVLAEWYSDEAVAYLHERAQERQRPPTEIG